MGTEREALKHQKEHPWLDLQCSALFTAPVWTALARLVLSAALAGSLQGPEE